MIAHPYYLDAPDELTCDYQRRPMTLEEAQSYYQGNVRRLNLTLAQWQCASSKDDLSWKEDRTWSKEYERAQKRFNSALSEVEWPADVKTKVARLIDRNQSEVYYLRSAYNHKSLGQSFTSGDFWKWIRAADKSSEAASQVRLTLRIPAVPTAPDNCVQARRLQRALDIASD